MARISAGSTLSNQFVPPFVISKNITTNWQLRWNNDLKAFEAFDPSEDLVDARLDTVEGLFFPTVVAQSVFIVPWVAGSEESLIVTVDGIKQTADTYSLDTITSPGSTVITLDAPVTGNVEVVGFVLSGETPSNPVEGSNLGAGPTIRGLYRDMDVTGVTQTLNFISLAEGSNVTITPNVAAPNTTFYTVAAIVPTFSNVGTGVGLVVDAGVTDPLQIRTIDGDDNRIAVAVASNTITVSFNHGYAVTSGATYNATATDRIIGVANTGSAVTVNLTPIANVPAGDTITVKDQTGGAGANNITLVTPGAETIDGANTYVINSAYGYVTLYSNGTNYFVIAEG